MFMQSVTKCFKDIDMFKFYMINVSIKENTHNSSFRGVCYHLETPASINSSSKEEPLTELVGWTHVIFVS